MNHWLSKIILALLLSLFASSLTTGCSTTVELAEEHLREGRSDDALLMIAKARSQDEHNPEIDAAEKRIRQQWLADKLIQVRLLRLGGNHQSSGKLLREVLERQSQWVAMPTGAVFSTQAEEVQLLAGRILSDVRQALRDKKPLLASELLRRDESLLRDTLKIDPTNLRQHVRDAIADFCKNEARTLNHDDHFHMLFLQRTCSTEKAAPAAVAFRTVSTRSSVRLFQKLEPRFEVTDLPPRSRQEVGDELEKAFSKSIWFEPKPFAQDESVALAIEIRGNLIDQMQSRPAYRSKPFSVQMPYEERSVRQKQERNGITTLFEVLAWALTTYQPAREIDNGDGTVTVYKTRYRTETRYHTYEVKEFTQTLTADWNIRLLTPGRRAPSSYAPLSRAFRFHEVYRLTSDEHSTHFPEANIHPETRKALAKEDWIKTINHKLMDKVGKELTSAWVQKFCFFQIENVPLDESELHHRCLYGANSQAPAESNSWFVRKYGIEIETWRRLVGMSESA